MTVEAQDALLKTLEEPPPAAILILVTAYADTLLADDAVALPPHPFRAAVGADVARVLVERAEAWTAARPPRAGRRVGRQRRARAGGEDRRLRRGSRRRAGLLVAAGRGRSAIAQGGSRPSPRTARTAAIARPSATARRSSASLLRDLSVRWRRHSARRSPIPISRRELRALVRRSTCRALTASYAALNHGRGSLDRNASPKIVADWIAVTI